jgi:hypothetical protein
MVAEEPEEVRTAALLWVLAVAAGIFEVLLVAADAFSGGAVPLLALVAGAVVRLMVAACVGTLLGPLRRGNPYARALLAFIGVAGVLVDPMTWQPVVFHVDWATLSRGAHLFAMAAAMTLMFNQKLRVYYRGRPQWTSPEGLPQSLAAHEQPAREQVPVPREEHAVNGPARLLQARP